MPDKESRTEKPTPKRMAEARKEGRIARSNDLVAWISIFIGFTILQITIGKSWVFLQKNLTEMGHLISKPDQHKALYFMVDSIAEGMIIVAPLTLFFMTLAIVANLMQVRFVLATKALKPNMKKLNPLTGLKRIFGMQGLFEAGKQLIKTILLGFVAYSTLWATMTGLSNNGPYGIGELMRIVGNASIDFIRKAALVGILIGIVDYVYQRKKTDDGLKMTKQEIKQESRQQDLAPEVKSKIKQKQRQMSRNRMMSAIKEADVVFVNPVHIAIALRYNPVLGAPKVIAKGAGFLAEKVKERAESHEVPIVQDVLLARTLHRSCDVDDEIPQEMFEAVARLLAFVFGLRKRGIVSGFHEMPGSMSIEEANIAEAKSNQELVPS